MKIHMTEIDGSLFEIEATLDDSTFLNIGPNAYDLCVNQGIHIYKGENGVHYLVDQDGNILASGMATIRTYIKFYILKVM